MTLEGYLPQTLPVQALAAETPDAAGRFTPNPLFAKLERVAPNKLERAVPKKNRKKVATKPKPTAEPEAPPPTAAAMPGSTPR